MEGAHAAGADAVHVHPRGRDGRESLTPTDVAAAILALRAAVPERPGRRHDRRVDPAGVEDRLRAIADWVVLPDFASVNVREEGSYEVAALLAERGIVVEAGVWDRPDAERVAAALPPGTGWLLLEPMDPEAEAALDTTAEIAEALAGVDLPRILHGLDTAAWAVLDESVRRGWGTRIGLGGHAAAGRRHGGGVERRTGQRGGRSRGRPGFFGRRPAFRAASVSRYSICALTLRRSSAAQRSSAA